MNKSRQLFERHHSISVGRDWQGEGMSVTSVMFISDTVAVGWNSTLSCQHAATSSYDETNEQGDTRVTEMFISSLFSLSLLPLSFLSLPLPFPQTHTPQDHLDKLMLFLRTAVKGQSSLFLSLANYVFPQSCTLPGTLIRLH